MSVLIPFAISKTSLFLTFQATIQPVIYPSSNYATSQPTIASSVHLSFDTSKYLYISNLCTHRPSFQSPKHLTIHSSTKLPIQSVIHPSGINLSVHLTTKSAIHIFIRRAIIISIDPSNHLYISKLSTHGP